MSGPPKDAPPNELWDRLLERPRPTREIQLPGKDKAGNALPKCKLWILTESEVQAARAGAHRVAVQFLRDPENQKELVDPNSAGYQEVFWNELHVQLVAAACRNAQDPKFPIFQTPKMARQILTTDEFALIVREYNAFRLDSGPMVSEMTVAEMDAWLEVLKDGASRSPFSRLSSEAMIDLILHLASKLTNSPTASGSAGSPQDDSSQKAPNADLVDASELPRSE